MTLYQLIMPRESAWQVMDRLGKFILIRSNKFIACCKY